MGQNIENSLANAVRPDYKLLYQMAIGLKQRAYAHIRAKLMRGDFEPGRGLSNRALARELGTSPVPIREAICQLEAEGVLEQRPWSGTYPRKLSPQEWMHLFEMREVLEGNAAYHAATCITGAQISGMKIQCGRYQQIIDDVTSGKFTVFEGELAWRLSECEMKFHTIPLEAAGNPIAIKIVDQFQILTLALDALRGLIAPINAELVSRLNETQLEHLELVSALHNGDGDAARAAIVRHYTTGMRWCQIDLERASHGRNDGD